MIPAVKTHQTDAGHARPGAGLLVGLLLAWTPLGDAATALAGTAPTTAQAQLDTALSDAAQRFGVPRNWLAAIITAESASDPRAVSSAGAMGLMQIMPATWRELRLAHGLGADPFDVGDNVLAGAAYVRQLYDRYGAPGFLAAYNAGPARYEAYRDTARPLPAETRRYVADLSTRLGFGGPVLTPFQSPPDWRRATLFPASPAAEPPVPGGLFTAVPERSDR